ncbi:hypothetical protein [uncultured Mailhella sp.]|uniref:hypothetical protein n=1 Tax=uncultured Mailhella sp. TaxID=1981031 RepID=UPI0025E7D14C|nr:hypothetical protein [uncultured Mailhella sp.]
MMPAPKFSADPRPPGRRKRLKKLPPLSGLVLFFSWFFPARSRPLFFAEKIIFDISSHYKSACAKRSLTFRPLVPFWNHSGGHRHLKKKPFYALLIENTVFFTFFPGAGRTTGL